MLCKCAFIVPSVRFSRDATSLLDNPFDTRPAIWRSRVVSVVSEYLQASVGARMFHPHSGLVKSRAPACVPVRFVGLGITGSVETRSGYLLVILQAIEPT